MHAPIKKQQVCLYKSKWLRVNKAVIVFTTSMLWTVTVSSPSSEVQDSPAFKVFKCQLIS